MNQQILFLKPTKRQQRARMLNHLIPGVLLLFTGVDELTGGRTEHISLPWLNIIIGLSATILIVYELKYSHKRKHSIVNYVDIVAGFILLLEGINHYHPNKFFQPALFYVIIALATILMGIFHHQMRNLHQLVQDDEGFTFRNSPFFKFRMRWKDIVAITIGDRLITLTTHDNRKHKINLRRIENREEIKSILRNKTLGKLKS
ncbi:MAG: hypothetical protein ACHQQQ_00435 [Bacteroidota bacterium]